MGSFAAVAERQSMPEGLHHWEFPDSIMAPCFTEILEAVPMLGSHEKRAFHHHLRGLGSNQSY